MCLHKQFSPRPTPTKQANTSTFQQRYFVCDRHHKRHGPIFFYLGNEADVTLYLNNTGATRA